jgi:undecaprenyl-diphosphatase
VLVGYFAQEYIRSAFRSLWLTAIVLIEFGILLGLADWLGKRTRGLSELSYTHGILFGLPDDVN